MTEPEAAPLSDLLDAVVAYLRDLGVEPTVVGQVGIRHDPAERRYNHELVVRFTAVLPESIPAVDVLRR